LWPPSPSPSPRGRPSPARSASCPPKPRSEFWAGGLASFLLKGEKFPYSSGRFWAWSRPPPPPIWVIRNLVKYGKGEYKQVGAAMTDCRSDQSRPSHFQFPKAAAPH
jgi:hypothetical protein